MIPTTTVLIAAYNVEKYVGRAIRSILNQSVDRNSFEIIVINDGSTDRTRFALEVFENDIKLFNNNDRLGLPASLNRGIRKARGRYIVRLDADDYVHTDFIRVLELILSMNDDIDAIACDYLMVDDSEQILGRYDCMNNPIACGIMFKIEHLIEIGLYDEAFLCKEDEDLRIRFLKKYKIDRVKLPLYRYRRHEGNMTNNIEKTNKYSVLLEQKHNGKD